MIFLFSQRKHKKETPEPVHLQQIHKQNEILYKGTVNMFYIIYMVTLYFSYFYVFDEWSVELLFFVDGCKQKLFGVGILDTKKQTNKITNKTNSKQDMLFCILCFPQHAHRGGTRMEVQFKAFLKEIRFHFTVEDWAWQSCELARSFHRWRAFWEIFIYCSSK